MEAIDRSQKALDLVDRLIKKIEIADEAVTHRQVEQTPGGFKVLDANGPRATRSLFLAL